MIPQDLVLGFRRQLPCASCLGSHSREKHKTPQAVQTETAGAATQEVHLVKEGGSEYQVEGWPLCTATALWDFGCELRWEPQGMLGGWKARLQ